MRFTITASETHQGKILDIDCDQETISILDTDSRSMGSVTWDSLIEWVKATSDVDESRHARAHPRAPLAVKVHYTTPEGKAFDGLTGGIGGGGLFIESSMPLPVGSEVHIEFALPDRPLETIHASGKVCWVRAKPDRFTLYPGMGVQFTDIDTHAREHVMELVKSLIHVRQARTVPQ
ncbi:PilZ domain-containing protein [Nitrospira sp. Nam74]